MLEPKGNAGAAPSAAKFELTFAAQGCVMGRSQDVAICVWATDVTPTLVEEYGKLLDHMATMHQLFSMIHIAPTARPLPSGEVRSAFARIADQHADRILLTAVMIVGGGFWASAVRSMITSVQVITRRKLNARVCGSTDEVLTWLAPEHSARTGQQLDVPQLRAAIEAVLDHPSVEGVRAHLG